MSTRRVWSVKRERTCPSRAACGGNEGFDDVIRSGGGLASGKDLPIWRDRGFGMWPLYDKRGLPWPLFDKQGRPRTWVVIPLFVFMTAAYILVAIAVTLYSGLAYAAIYWILSGFFLFLLAAGLFVFLMKRRQEAKIR